MKFPETRSTIPSYILGISWDCCHVALRKTKHPRWCFWELPGEHAKSVFSTRDLCHVLVQVMLTDLTRIHHSKPGTFKTSIIGNHREGMKPTMVLSGLTLLELGFFSWSGGCFLGGVAKEPFEFPMIQ